MWRLRKIILPWPNRHCTQLIKQWKHEQVWPFFGSFQLIYRLTQADISCTTTAGLFFSPLLATDRDWLTCESGPCLSEWRPSYGIDRGRRCTLEVRGHDPSEEVL